MIRYTLWFANGWTYDGGDFWSMEMTMRRGIACAARTQANPRVIAVIGTPENKPR